MKAMNDKKDESDDKDKCYRTIRQIAEDETFCFTEPALRYYVAYAHRNGLKKAIRRVGSKILIRRDLFIEWIESYGERK